MSNARTIADYANDDAISGDKIHGGTISGVTLSSPTINTPTFANDAISGDKIHGGTISSSALATTVTMSANHPAVKTAINASGSAPIYACRAWVNFNGTGTVAIRESGNVSSITDNSTGNYTVNFTTAMPDANYAIISTNVHHPGVAVWDIAFRTDSISTGSCGIQSMNTTNTAAGDSTYLSLSIFR
jgi:hypothetical protein